MSIYGKGLVGAIIVGPITGAIARFLAAGEWTWQVAVRHIGYAVFSGVSTILLLEYYTQLASLSFVAIAALGAALVPIIARVLIIISKAAFKGRIFGIEFNSGENNDT